MTKYNIAIIRGDGVGPEVIEEGIKVLTAVGIKNRVEWNFTDFPWGSEYYLKHGEMMPSNGIETLSSFDAIYLGAIGHPDIQDHVTLNGLLLPIRRSFDQYVCERPSVLYPGISSPLRDKQSWDIDMVVIRENTEGEYADIGGFQYEGFSEELGVQTGIFTRHGCERVITYAFELARRRNKKRLVTSVTKSNAQGYGMIVWDRAFERVSSLYPEIQTESLLVDAACMDFVRRPESFDVVVASNLFGDILTDIGAVITGSMGLAPSANLNPESRFPSMFEPVHGSAPDIVGKQLANPIAAILSGAMMLRHLKEEKAAADVEQGVLKIIGDSDIRTPDLGGQSKTPQVSQAIIDALP